MNPLKLSALALGLAIIAQSCSSPTYVESTPPPQAYSNEAPAPVSYQSFYNELSPYGQWVNTQDYGYVWVPAAGPDFQPYATAGYWSYTDYGWTWVSNYSWGWAPFHYGTWDFDGTLGWYWIPGYQWSPAWVSWRSTPGYYGWAPLGPTYTYNGYATYNCPPERYVFVNASYMNNPNMGRYYEPRAQNASYFSRSAVVTNTYYDRGSNNTYHSGPPSTEVERYTKSPVRPVTVVQASSPEREGVSGNQISMFRPSVQQPNSNNASRPAPEKVYQKAEVTPVTQRPVQTNPNQPRATPYKPENIQHPENQPGQQNKPKEENKPQQPPQQQQPSKQQQPVQQQPAQQPSQRQQPPVNQQHAPVQQQPAKQQKQKQSKPPKQTKPQQQNQQGGQPQPGRQ